MNGKEYSQVAVTLTLESNTVGWCEGALPDGYIWRAFAMPPFLPPSWIGGGPPK